MQELSFMDNKTFDKAVTIIIDILQEIYYEGQSITTLLSYRINAGNIFKGWVSIC